MAGEKTGLAGFIDWLKNTRVVRGLMRYGTANGNLLAGGIAFSALFSVVAAITLAFTAFTIVLGGNEELHNRVVDSVAEALPGVIQTGDDQSSGILNPDSLTFSGGTGIAGVIAVIILLNSAIRVPAGLRLAIRAMFGMVAPPESPVLGKLRDLAGFLGLALSVLLTSALGIAAGAAGDWLLSLVGWDGTTAGTWILRFVGLLVVLVVDVLVFVWLYRTLAGVRPPRKDLWIGALVAGVGAGVIRYLGTAVVSGSLETSPVAGAAAAVATLLLWINLIVRVTLMMAAWVSNPPAPPEVEDDMVTHFDESPNYVTLSDPETLAWQHDPVTGRVQPEDPPPPEPYWGGLIGWIGRKIKGARDA
ncbi:YihY/virulence factor BrkB family protein [Ruania halotolerans]|uniref:YihY/virulence factor BrkB family protein n=1 Tax=Ruania halotolerans TaxID=2897773 RepID=UPI001E5147FC|nr:YihY/virulence factor BrkB family protein [Ruania halotolerans]UFU05616.1 YihY/virulence factor BrkB family protein [Ruania halotolerans]